MDAARLLRAGVGKTGIKVYSAKIHFIEGVEDLLG